MKNKKALQDSYSHACLRAFQLFKVGRRREKLLEEMLEFLVENDSINDSSIEKEVIALLINSK